jgi:hypothetical protein
LVLAVPVPPLEPVVLLPAPPLLPPAPPLPPTRLDRLSVRRSASYFRVVSQPGSEEPPAIDDDSETEVSPNRRADQRRRGSLRGTLVMTEDWDSDEINEAIARDFGVKP